jgi:superfamily II DNA/RNA helicase
LFSIQAECLPHALAKSDIVGRARTGCGKTFAFVLPVVEILMRENLRPSPNNVNVICLLPTRELAKQVRSQYSTSLHREYIFNATTRMLVIEYYSFFNFKVEGSSEGSSGI